MRFFRVMPLILLALIMCLGAGCGNGATASPPKTANSPGTESGAPETQAQDQDIIADTLAADIEAKVIISGSKGCMLEIENKSDMDCILSDDYYLEIDYYGEWERVKTRPGSGQGNLDIEYVLEPGESQEFSYGWISLYGELGNGKFRIVKRAFLGDDPDRYFVAAEFEVSRNE